MSELQPGIFDKSHRLHLFEEFVMRKAADADELKQNIGQLYALATDSVSVTLAIGPELWALLGSGFSFPPFSLEGQVPATQGDLLIWLQGDDRGDLFDVALSVRSLLADSMDSQLELDAFVYHDSRDLTGFVDGIGNPSGDAALEAATVASGHPGAGGSFVLTQKWVHDLARFHGLPVSEQENVIGRTKEDAVEFDAARMPADAHVGRTDVKRDGVAQKIWRRSVPFGNSSEHGLYFVAFSCELDRFDYLLRRMYGMTEDGIRDRLLDFSQPVMSSCWYAPPVSWLQGGED